ncbi:MAG: acyl-CoA dehydrogenase family protein [Actinomycetota bacterium]|nr:acyl-CoA dehydrogenase family protein [Actinomycetota bacterium]
MSSFALDPDQQRLIDEVRAIARDHLAPIAERGEPGRVNRPLVRALAEHGLLGRLFPSSAGGSAREGPSAMELCLLREALARESTEAETALALQGLGAFPILQSGDEEVIRRFVTPVARGEGIAAFALTEPAHGSDAAALQLLAERDGDGWRLTGEKTYISNAPDADVYTVFARTTPDAGGKGVTAFAVTGDAAGLSGASIEMLAPHVIGSLRFDGVRVEGDCVLGEVDRGFRVALRTLDLFRPSVGAFAVGMAWAALDAATAHAAERRSFDRPLRDHQAVSHLLAEMAARTEAARMLVYSAAGAVDRGDADVSKRSAMAKLVATETAQWVVDAAMQVHGARGLERGHLLERLYREVRAPRIYEGTSEIQREIIARELYRGGETRPGGPTVPP